MLICTDVLIIFKLLVKTQNQLKVLICKKPPIILVLILYTFLFVSLYTTFL